MTGMLHDQEAPVYPSEYLVSRLKGRVSTMIGEWQAVAVSPSPYEALLALKRGRDISRASLDAIWREMLKEMQWVYLQMNSGLREVFGPFFLYHEIGTIHLCLRFRLRKGSDERIARLLSFSLLSEGLREVLQRVGDVPSLLEELESHFVQLSERFRGLRELYLEKNSGDVEQRFITRYLEFVVHSRIHPLVERFFIYLIDMRNLMALYKHLRWGITAPPEYVQGGSLTRRTIESVYSSQDMSGMDRMVQKVSSLGEDIISVAGPENSLLRGLTKLLRLSSRVDVVIGYILYYLWRCHVQARNIGIVLSGKELGRDALTGELIR